VDFVDWRPQGTSQTQTQALATNGSR